MRAVRRKVSKMGIGCVGGGALYSERARTGEGRAGTSHMVNSPLEERKKGGGQKGIACKNL